jgi:DNA-binding CsgD family transcriptional regulator
MTLWGRPMSSLCPFTVARSGHRSGPRSAEILARAALTYLLDALGYDAARSGQSRLAAQLLGAADSVRTGAGARIIPIAPVVAQAEESARGALGAAKFDAEFNAGKRLSRGAALGLALGAPVHAAAAVSNGADRGPLAKREFEVARLIADGLSNKQIGARLLISERTVASHVRSILNKLGFSTRAQVAGWLASSNS